MDRLVVFFWDPPRHMFSFSLPFLHRPILWYGFFFALGFLLGYWIFVYALQRHCQRASFFMQQKSFVKQIAEKILVYAVVGTVIGARLGDVLFYQDWHRTIQNPWDIIKVWEGGLSSHGGVIGVLVALYLFFRRERKRLPFHSFWGLLDLVCIPSACIAGFIRVGNFFNQEVLGVCTKLPWGVIFGHPVEGGTLCPRHPVQLYESAFYFFTILFLVFYQRLGKREEGKSLGLFLSLVFGFRIFIEYFKLEQSAFMPASLGVNMGQILSLPLLCLGLFLLLRRKK